MEWFAFDGRGVALKKAVTIPIYFFFENHHVSIKQKMPPNMILAQVIKSRPSMICALVKPVLIVAKRPTQNK
jgi:hypothetical protein